MSDLNWMFQEWPYKLVSNLQENTEGDRGGRQSQWQTLYKSKPLNIYYFCQFYAFWNFLVWEWGTLGESCNAWTIKNKVIPEYITHLTVLNTHNSRVFVVLLLLSFFLIDALKFNLHKCQRKQKYYKYYLCNAFRNSSL